MSIDELQNAMRGAAQRKVNAGHESRDPIANGLDFHQRPTSSRFPIIVAVLCALLLLGFTLSYLRTVPPSHILIIALGLFWVFGWGFKRRKKV